MTAKVERLINLVVALLDARRPLQLAEIRRSVAGYGQDELESSRRMFERDKDELRRLGVPVETVPVDALGPEVGYIIDRGAYILPPIDFTVAEMTALAVALQVAADEGARPGYTKVATRAPDPLDADAPPARVDVGADALDDIAEALLWRRSLRFGYRTATGQVSTRTVDGYGVAHRRGSWYLVGRDHVRGAVRAFRLDRLTDRPRAVGEPGVYTVPDGLDLTALVAGPASEGLEAEVAFAPAAAWQASRRGVSVKSERQDGWSVVRFADVDPPRFLPWVLALGADAEVLGPPELRAEAIARLRRLAALPPAGGPR